MRKWTIPFFIGAAFFLHGIGNASSSSTVEENTPCCAPPEASAACAEPSTECVPCCVSPSGEILSVNFSPQIISKNDLYFDGRCLYLTVQEGGLYFAQTAKYVSSENYTPWGPVSRITPSWDVGFKFQAGYKTCEDNWDLSVSWMRFYSSKSKESAEKLHPDTADKFITLWGHISHQHGDLANYAKGKWHLKDNCIDLQLGRSSLFGRCLTLRPFVGLQAADISQRLKIRYHYILSQQNNFGTVIPRSDFKGIGVNGGVDLFFSFSGNFGLYANTSMALLYSKFDCLMQTYHTDPTFSFFPILIGESTDNFYKTIPHGSMTLGLQASWYVTDCSHLGIRVGWLQDMWFGANKMLHYIHKLADAALYQKNENLSLQGVTVDVQYDF